MISKKIRRYDLDWLRVLVFGLLIIYHVGMFFVNWDWHIKNNIINYDLGWPMAFINRWRLHILFVISGMGTFYALSHRSIGEFAWERIKRLALPFVFGIFVIVPPQVYYEMLSKNEFSGSYMTFLSTEFLTNISWNHLWFLPYLLVFSLILIPVFNYLRNNRKNTFTLWFEKMLLNPWSLYLLVIPLYLVEAFIEPYFDVTHNLINDWFAFTNFIILFFYGFLLISFRNVFWKAIDKIKIFSLIIGLVAFGLLVKLWYMEDTTAKHYFEALIAVINFWSWIITIIGFAAKYLNKKSNFLAYSNRAVYPFYILHQTIIIIGAYYIKDLEWSFLLKFSLLNLGTFVTCWLIYHFIILKISIIHPLFGLKKTYQNHKKNNHV